MIRVPQRKYSPQALENWFQRMVEPWERQFKQAELERAREIYRQGEVRSVELAEDHAIVYGGRSNEDVYAVLDWKPGTTLAVRHSVSDKGLGRALAAAGLYEIEELVADEVEALSEDADQSGAQATAVVSEPAPKLKKPVEPGRPLHVTLSTTSRGLRMEAHWEGDGKKRENAFRSRKLAPGERESLIALTMQARKAGFGHRTFSGDYILRDPTQIADFLRKELGRWRQRFCVSQDPSVHALSRGVRSVEVGLHVARNGHGMRYQWSGRLGGKLISDELLGQLLRQPDRTLLDGEAGMLRVSRKQAAWIADWQPFLEERFEGALPFYMLFSLQGQSAVPVELSRDLEAWRKELEAGVGTRAEAVPGVLRPYQEAGVQWLRYLHEAQCHPLLADEMGLGKTLQVLSLLWSDPVTRERPALVVCPASVLPVWEAEARRFFPEMRTRRLRKGNAFEEREEGVLWLSSYTQLRRHRDRLGEREFSYAILDEAQVIKNPDAKVTHACWAIRARRRLAVTGTPIENRQLDVWSIFRFLMPGLLGTRRRFEEEMGKDEVKGTERLRHQLAPFVLRRTKAEVGNELPEKIETVLPCPLTDVQVAEYRRLVESGERELGEDTRDALRSRAMPLFTLLTRLRQVCCDPGLLPWRQDDVSQSGKLLTLCDRLESALGSGRKAVIFSQFVRFLDRADEILQDRFPAVPRFRLDGRTAERAVPVREFQEREGPGLILVSLKAGGTGITLHAADYVFLLDPWWNPAVEAQAIDRVHRIGQTQRVMVYRLVAQGTVESRIEELKAQKQGRFDALVGGMEGAVDWASQFDRLADLIAYREE